MKYFETKHEQNSAKITALLALIILLLLFVVGPPYMDPPEEYGIAVNFGTSNFGSGNVQPKQPVKTEPREIEQPTKPETAEKELEPEPVKATSAQEEVLTENNAEAIAIKKQKAAEAKAKAEADAKAKAEAERIAKEKALEAKKKREQEEKKRKLDALIGGVSKSKGTTPTGEGNDARAGDKGQLDGNPYAPSYFGGKGSGSGGVGYGLNGRGRPSFKRLEHNCNESGMVIVKIVVNTAGKVIEAIPGVKGTTNTATCLLEPAKAIALSHKWPSDAKAPSRQIGFVSVKFKLSQ